MSLLILLAQRSSGPSTPTSSIALYIFAALSAGGGLTLLAGLIRYWRKGQIDDTEVIARIQKDTMAGARDILSEYRIEVEVVKRQLEDYRVQLNDLTSRLAESNVRIRHLEEELTQAGIQRERLVAELHEAIEERARLRDEIIKLRQAVTKLTLDDDAPQETTG